MYLFSKKGQILIDRDKAEEDDVMMIALDNGAEDVQTTEEGYEVLTAPADFADVYRGFEEAGIEMMDAEVAMIPSMETEIEGENVKYFTKMLDMFSDNEDVQEVWHNCVYDE
jgi:transcriptional/translational regulatory protein YebC/TACO1